MIYRVMGGVLAVIALLAAVVVAAAGVAVADVVNVGVGLRGPLQRWIRQKPEEISVLEVTAEHFFSGCPFWLRRLANHYPILLHGISLSLGSPQALEPARLSRWRRLCDQLKPTYITEHVSFVESPDLALGHLSPIPRTDQFLRILTDHIKRWQDECQVPVLMENITSHLAVPGEMPETEFLNELCRRAECGLLLDVTNLYVNSRNHDYCPEEWLRQIDPCRIQQLHLVGFQQTELGPEDFHNSEIQPVVLQLLERVLEVAAPEYCIIERDSNIPDIAAMSREVGRVNEVVRRHREKQEEKEQKSRWLKEKGYEVSA